MSDPTVAPTSTVSKAPSAARDGSGKTLSPESELVLVLDFGGQTAQLIARRVRDQNVFCQLVRPDLSADRIRELNPRGLILSGGPASVYDPGAPLPDNRIFDLGIPILGICYGMQAACRALGTEVSPGTHREFGRTACRIEASRDVSAGDLFDGVPSELTVWMSHGDQVKNLTEQWVPLASTADCPAAAVRHRTRSIYCLQFHPEVTHTQCGSDLLGNFVKKICGCSGTWKMSSFIEQQVAAVRERVGDKRVICGLSGGSTHQWSPRCCSKPSVRNSPAFLSIPACCGPARPKP